MRVQWHPCPLNIVPDRCFVARVLAAWLQCALLHQFALRKPLMTRHVTIVAALVAWGIDKRGRLLYLQSIDAKLLPDL